MIALSQLEHVDFLVLGGGVAGLSFALEAADHGSVLVLTKRQRSEGSTHYAQGGIASVLGADDQFDLHVQDTLVAGAGLCKREAVEVTVREGPERIHWLLSLGVELDHEGPDLHLTREGGHSRGASRTRRTRPGARWSARSSRRAPRRGSGSSRTRWRSTSSRAGRSGSEARTAPRRLRPRPRLGRDRAGVRARDGARDRRRRQGLPLHDEPRRRDGRRRRDGVPRGRRGREHGVLPVPPDLPLPPAGEELPHQRGAPRRGRHPAQRRGRGVHDALRPAQGARAARHRGARHRRRDEAQRRRARVPRHHAPAEGLPPRALPEHLRDVPGVRDRHHGAADPGRARGALHVRRRS